MRASLCVILPLKAKHFDLWILILEIFRFVQGQKAEMTAFAAMNEVTWARVKQWELLHRGQCRNTKLRRFLGRPDELRCSTY